MVKKHSEVKLWSAAMDWCRERGLNPAFSWVWEIAKEEVKNTLKEEDGSEKVATGSRLVNFFACF